MNQTATTAGLLIALLTHPVRADPLKETGPYVGAAFGYVNFDDDGLLSGEQSGLTLDLDDNGGAWQVYGGFRLLKYFALEGRYTNFGKYRTDISQSGAMISSASIDFSELSLHGVGILPFGASGFDLFGQLGFGLMYYEGKFSLLDIEEDDDATLFSAGAGLRYTPPSVRALTVQLAYEFYGFELNNPFGENFDQRLHLGKLGFQYNF